MIAAPLSLTNLFVEASEAPFLFSMRSAVKFSSRLARYLLPLALFSGAASAQPLQEVKIGLSSASFATAPGRLSQELGLFAKHGLQPRFVSLESGAAAVTALISKSIDFALAGSGEFVSSNARGQNVAALLMVYGGSGGTIVLSKAVAEKLGVSHKAPVPERLKALDKLVFASPSGPSAYTVTLKNAAESAGANVRFTYMAQPAMPAALESGAIQGYISSAPFWALPVVRGTGVVWLSTPENEVPAKYTPASAITLQTMRAYAEANPELSKKITAVFVDFGKAVKERPDEVKTALAKLYPDLNAETLDLLFKSEALGWVSRPMTTDDVKRDIEFNKMSGAPLPQIDQVDPATMIYP